MKTLLNFLLFFLLAGAIALMAGQPASRYSYMPHDCQIDTNRIAVVEFTVRGMDSLTVDVVQDALDTACGVNFNFACWMDTVVFIEYDSLLTDKFRLMSLLNSLGYPSIVRLEY
ncbi:MAG: hypothetical protein EOM83_16005 [Clostridia bacterium]|nr:hypothetical protein [Clostridia bacterium]